MTCICLISDSRGRGLKDYIKKRYIEDFPEACNIPIFENCLPGGNFNTLCYQLKESTRVAKSQYPHHNITALLFGGICSFTHKISKPTKQEISYASNPRRIVNIKHALQDINTYCVSQNIRLITTTIPPASINKNVDFNMQHRKLLHSAFTDNERNDKQNELEQDVTEVNNFMTSCEAHAVNLHTEVQHTKRRRNGRSRTGTTKAPQISPKTRFCYKELTDGVHPTEALKTVIFKKIFTAITYTPLSATASSRHHRSERLSWYDKSNYWEGGHGGV